MTGEELRVGFFTEDAHYITAETTVDAEVEEGLEDLDPEYEDERGMVFDYSDARAVLNGEIDETGVKEDIRDEMPQALAYLNGDLQAYLEDNWGSNGVLIERNWPEKVEEKLDSGEHDLSDFDLNEAMIAVTYGEDPDDLRWSYMQDSFHDRHDVPTRGVEDTSVPVRQK
ncbi:MAG: hypothetical protein ABEJ36_02900 [Candidatus Nanosalina sp.]